MQGETLVAIVNPPAGEERSDQQETIIAMSADTGEVRWTHEIGYQTGNALLSDTMLVIPHYVLDTGATTQVLTYLDLATGEVIHEAGIEATSIPNISASGDVVCVYSSRVECGEPGSMERVSTGVALPNADGFNPPVMFRDGQIVVVNYETGVYVSAPATTPGATS